MSIQKLVTATHRGIVYVACNDAGGWKVQSRLAGNETPGAIRRYRSFELMASSIKAFRQRPH